MPDLIEPLSNQVLMRLWTSYACDKLGSCSFHLIEFIKNCFSQIGEDKIVQLLKEDQGNNRTRLNAIGNNWRGFNRKFKILCDKMGKAKQLYDLIEIKTFTKIESKHEMRFLSYMKSLNILQQDIYGLAYFLIGHSSLRGQTIPSQEWKIVENLGLKKLDVTPRRPALMENVGGSNEVNTGHK